MPYQLCSQAASGAPPSESDPSLLKRCKIIVRLKPRDTSVPVVDPPSSLADPAPLEPLFLGLDPETGSLLGCDDETGSPSPTIAPVLVHDGSGPSGQDYSPASPPQGLYNIDSRCPPLDLTTPEQQAAWRQSWLILQLLPPPLTRLSMLSWILLGPPLLFISLRFSL
ncbi:uncharacterized protein UBRO_20033 [Ustilago bromivora]|uniref:Uncharacterized protein n=1 Tax=Ustilago bromivora TaxID=307758 RepID=A0A1K0GZ60_9BASI|nr:uncharacterized protein UBRO_20033 [Ustilago bromivora]